MDNYNILYIFHDHFPCVDYNDYPKRHEACKKAAAEIDRYPDHQLAKDIEEFKITHADLIRETEKKQEWAKVWKKKARKDTLK
jgi:hypothetical protein